MISPTQPDLACVDLDKPMEAVRGLRRCVTGLGFTPRRFPPDLVEYMASRGGRRKVLFGTNFPMVGHAHALDGLDGLELDAEATDLYLAGNAQRMLGL